MKKRILLGILIILFVVPGCSKKIESTESFDGKLNLEELISNQEDDADARSENCCPVCDIGEGAYLVETDEFGNFLYYYDYASKQYTKVCSKPECEHKDDSCNAFFQNGMDDEHEYFDSIQWYDGAILVGGLDKQKACIYKIEGDGSGQEKLIDLFDAQIEEEIDEGSTTTSYSAFKFCAHRGYIYYIVEEGEATSFCRKAIDGKGQEEQIVASTSDKSIVYRVEPYGRYVFFQQGEYNDDYSAINSKLCAYDTETGAIIDIKDQIVSSYQIKDNHIYYEVMGEGIHDYSLENNTDHLVAESDEIFYQIYKAGNFFIAASQFGFSIFDDEGMLVKEIEKGTNCDLFYANDQVIIASYGDGNGNHVTAFVTNLEDDVENWSWEELVIE